MIYSATRSTSSRRRRRRGTYSRRLLRADELISRHDRGRLILAAGKTGQNLDTVLAREFGVYRFQGAPEERTCRPRSSCSRDTRRRLRCSRARSTPSYGSRRREHRYYHAGGELPGVSAVLEGVAINDYSTIPAYILEPAQERGRRVHLARHIEDTFGDLDESTCTDEMLGHLTGWRRVPGAGPASRSCYRSNRCTCQPDGRRSCRARARSTRSGSSPTLCVSCWPILKTGDIPPGVGPQTAAYALMCRVLGIADPAERWCVKTNRDGTYKLHPLDKPTDLHAFVSAVWLWHWKRGFS